MFFLVPYSRVRWGLQVRSPPAPLQLAPCPRQLGWLPRPCTPVPAGPLALSLSLASGWGTCGTEWALAGLGSALFP